ncbi:macro domain-containing protein [Pontibacillus salicampi]|uniref:macro domain-containing protein n=1 Tax=Pontibacillus salicampi TaxID=1449801 RepID=UPI00366A73F2
MKVKIKLFDRILIKDFIYVLSVAGVLFSLFSVIIDVPDKAKIYAGVGILIFLICTYLLMWVRANKLINVELTVDNSKVNIKVGDLFEEQGFKVIAFNEYFDTIVDNKVISENTLNGIYLNNYVSDIEELNARMEVDRSLEEKMKNTNESRTHGKKHRYRLGTIFQDNDYLLTALSKFDNDNRAYLHMNDYINFLLNFWNEIDIVYAGNSVTIPLMGSGITRFKEYNHITDQELLELLLWSFKISRIKFTYPAKVTIIIHEGKKDKINFYKLKEVI